MWVVDLASRISRWRLSRDGLTKAELARQVGVSPEAVSQWESGATTPTTANLAKIVGAIGVTMQVFWGEPPASKRRRAS